MVVIPARREAASPESITTARHYGSRAPSLRSGPGMRAALAEKASHPCSYPARSRFFAPRIEVPAQPLPAVDVIVLSHLEISRVFGQALREARFEHEGHRIRELHRLELAVARVLEGGLGRAVRQHAIVQRDAARHETLRLGVVNAVDQAHEFRHQVAVVPGWPEGV